MTDRKIAKPVALAVGAALAGSFAIANVASADAGASPFAMTTLSAGYMLGAGEGNCGGDKGDTEKAKAEGACGGDKQGEEKAKDAEGSCGGDKAEAGEDKDAEGKCGEGKCGGDKAKAGEEKDKDAEGKCGGAN